MTLQDFAELLHLETIIHRLGTRGSQISPSADNIRHLRAFCSPVSGEVAGEALGNPCRVSTLHSPRSSPPAASDMTHCHTWQDDWCSATVKCFTASAKPIQCCGHGTLCCAALWLEQWGQPGILAACGGEVECLRRDRVIWLGFSSLTLAETAAPDWLASELGLAAVRCAHTLEPDGYLVVELARGSGLAELAPPVEKLGRRTSRALIITSKAPGGTDRASANIHFRYFAPQYGVAEDMATGSAMRVLASFWAERGLGPRLEAWQCSEYGGLLYSEIREGRTWVGGHVEEEFPVESPG